VLTKFGILNEKATFGGRDDYNEFTIKRNFSIPIIKDVKDRPNNMKIRPYALMLIDCERCDNGICEINSEFYNFEDGIPCPIEKSEIENMDSL
jgi:hypothetical protein